MTVLQSHLLDSSAEPVSRWRIHGLEVASDLTDCDLPPGRGERGEIVDVTVLPARVPFPEGRDLLRIVRTEGGNPEITLYETGEGFVYSAEGIARFWIEPDGRRVWYEVSPEASTSDIDHLLAGPVLGLAYQQLGGVTLHASAVMLNEVAVAFSAPHGFGKSTLALGLTRMGHPLITDDVLPLRENRGTWTAQHSLSRAKLWPDSLQAFGEDEESYGEVVSWLPKKRLTIGRDFGSLAPDRLPLGAIYLLTPRRDPCPVEVFPVGASDAAITLLGNFYMAETLRGERARTALDAAARLAESVPVRRLMYQRTYDNIAPIRDAVLQDLESLAASCV